MMNKYIGISKKYVGTGNIRYKGNCQPQIEAKENLKKQGFKLYEIPDLRHAIWKNEKTGEVVIVEYKKVPVMIEDAKEVGE